MSWVARKPHGFSTAITEIRRIGSRFVLSAELQLTDPDAVSTLDGEITARLTEHRASLAASVLPELAAHPAFVDYAAVRDQLRDAERERDRHGAKVAELQAQRQLVALGNSAGLADQLMRFDRNTATAQQAQQAAEQQAQVLRPIVEQRQRATESAMYAILGRHFAAAVQALRDEHAQLEAAFLEAASSHLMALVATELTFRSSDQGSAMSLLKKQLDTLAPTVPKPPLATVHDESGVALATVRGSRCRR